MHPLCRLKTVCASKIIIIKKSCSYLLRHTDDLFAYTGRDPHAAFEVWSTGIIGRCICLTYSSFFFLLYLFWWPVLLDYAFTWKHQTGLKWILLCEDICNQETCSVQNCVAKWPPLFISFRTVQQRFPKQVVGAVLCSFQGKKNHSQVFLLNFSFPSTKKIRFTILFDLSV